MSKINYNKLIRKVNESYIGDKVVPYMGNNSLPDPKSTFEYDVDRVKIIKKCHRDILFFAENFFYIISAGKKQKIELRDYQKDGLNLFQDNNKTIFNTSRQMGKSTLMTIYVLWMVTFFEYRKVLVVANKADTAKEILGRIKLAYEELPNWLKPSVNSWNKQSVEFKNGSDIKISATSADAARGQSLNCLVVDEVAHIDDHVLEEFWSAVYPTISNDPNARILMASTPNGVGNLFHELWENSQNDGSSWGSLEVLWNSIPGRGKDWADEKRRDLGNEKFEQEYECKFLESGGSNIPEELYNQLASECRKPRIELSQFSGYNIYTEPDLENKIYVAGVDIGEGCGACNSSIQILDVTDMTKIEQVAVYANNDTGPNEFARQLNEIMKHWGKPPLAIERNNTGGGTVVTLMDKEYNYPCLVNFAFKQGRIEYGHLKGVTSSTNTKYYGVMNMFYFLKTHKRIKLRELDTLKELNTFVRHKNERWAKKTASYKDDRVDALIWALICVHEAVVTQFFTVNMWDDNKKPFGLEPLYEVFGKKDFRNFGTEDSNWGIDSVIMPMGGDIDPSMQDMFDDGWLTPEMDDQSGFKSYEPSPYQFL